MSRIGKKPIQIPEGVTVVVTDANITVTGPKGTLTREFLPYVSINVDGDSAVVQLEDETKRAYWGLMRAHLQNMVTGVSRGFEKRLEIIGTGYRAQMQGKKLVMSLGFSHPVEMSFPEGITIEIPEPTKIVVKGISRDLVGQKAADIRHKRPPEPYKGKGIRYVGEYVRRKVGKANV